MDKKSFLGRNRDMFMDAEMYVRASEELEKEVKDELDIPDPSSKKIIELVGSGKLIGRLHP